MPPRKHLSESERNFFELVFKAGMTNPFSDARSQLDASIAGVFPETDRQERIRRMVEEVARKISLLEKEGRANLEAYEGRDKVLLRTTFLFELFYAFRRKFDALIEAQVAAGTAPVRVPFTRDALALLQKRGLKTRHTFELAFQLRRAYHFIDRSLSGRSPSMKKFRESLWNNVFTQNLDLYERYLVNRMEDFSTLILGETGTGKGSAAAAIGRSGYIPFDPEKERFVESFTLAFVPLNLSQFPESLMESELFGHKKGAFTGAVDDFKGVFARCSPHGAIFLDEIGEVSTPVQIKLLNVLQERIFYPVGSHEAMRFHGRVIAATNKSLQDLREKVFRDDFYYRLSSDIIEVPPLRHRIREDPKELDTLLDHTVTRLVGIPSPELVEMAKQTLARKPGPDYPWPGNVREVEQAVRRILLTSVYEGEKRSRPVSLDAHILEGIESGTLTAQELLMAYCARRYEDARTYEEVARQTGLDRRTVKKYIDGWRAAQGGHGR
ncbi:sigma-54-dependent transcriptional regulator [Desulfobotulus mexicanus]|uniref:Sigma-54-dependent Fis family transcriptional regulator n=1 Tax=Desulfobotulus mexicanus TaxID=2586642 RepID=A0A5Q4VC14_9BACT|nr:sigma 54-interacting transcriptional regulator [Desulfobotulus mexicanus]TYT75244.1 sigma-54-dependent Fis family transcriptional regulator [Desulfobotulus mexicanus]